MPYVEIAHPDRLKIDDHGALSFGAQQTWYPTRMQRNGGCAPTTCSDQMLYLSQAQPSLSALCPHDASARDGMLSLMQDVWAYIKPGFMGVNKISMLSEGALRYAQDRDCSLRHRSLDVPKEKNNRPAAEAMLAFVQESIGQDHPVAFLNLSSGEVRRLPGWHWMLLIGVDAQAGSATLLDEGIAFEVDLGRWLETSKIGGGFVALMP